MVCGQLGCGAFKLTDHFILLRHEPLPSLAADPVRRFLTESKTVTEPTIAENDFLYSRS